MSPNKKAAPPAQASTLGKAASVTTIQSNNFHLFKEQIKKIIVMSALWGLIPAWLGCWLIGRGDEHDD